MQGVKIRWRITGLFVKINYLFAHELFCFVIDYPRKIVK